MSTLKPKITAMPTTKVRRTSSIREVITCKPPRIIKQATYTSTAPVTGAGITENAAASFGKQARATRMSPAGKATARLVTPVAIDNPTLLEKVDCPIPPISPDRVVPMDPARIPGPLISYRCVSSGYH